jgi:hypothetical protein
VFIPTATSGPVKDRGERFGDYPGEIYDAGLAGRPPWSMRQEIDCSCWFCVWLRRHDVVRGVQCAGIPVRAVRNAGCSRFLGRGDPVGLFCARPFPRPL